MRHTLKVDETCESNGTQIKVNLYYLVIGNMVIKAYLKYLASMEVVEHIKAPKTKYYGLIGQVNIEKWFFNHYKMVFQAQRIMEKIKVAKWICINVVLRH